MSYNPLDDFFEGRTGYPSDVCPGCGEKYCICLDEDDYEEIEEEDE